MQKKRVLAYSDGVLCGTGFGTVSKHVLRGLYDSGKYEIDQLAINYNGEFFDKEEYPYQLSPARLVDPRDPYGSKMFLQSIATGNYDYVWVCNDTHVVHETGRELEKLLPQLQTTGRKLPKIIYYYPVDCKVIPDFSDMLKVADWNVAYCKFGLEETQKAMPEVISKTSIINHGVDVSAFRRLPNNIRQELRKKYFNITDPNTVLFININRNSVRKQLAHTILAFSEYRKQNPNSKLYLHTAPQDTTIDLYAAVKDLGLSTKTDVIFPKGFAPHKPFPVSILNSLYNCGDAFLTTSLGEGWGLTHIEAMACGLPVICPDNTTFPEQLAGGERGYLYKCQDRVWIDNSGYRPSGRIEDIVEVMMKATKDIKSGRKDIVEAGMQYAVSLNWKNLAPQWIELFDKVGKVTSTKKVMSELL